MKELEILLNKRWVLKSRDKETYYKLRDALGELRKFTTEKMGCQIIDNSLLIKMEKIPVIPESFMGIQKFSSKEEYAYLCILLMFLEALLSPALSYWSGRQRFEYRYRILVCVTILQALMNPIASLVLIRMNGGTAMMRILGIVGVQVCICVPIIVFQFCKGKEFFSKEYWGYALRIGIPIVPHYLSGIILNQGDRIMIDLGLVHEMDYYTGIMFRGYIGGAGAAILAGVGCGLYRDAGEDNVFPMVYLFDTPSPEAEAAAESYLAQLTSDPDSPLMYESKATHRAYFQEFRMTFVILGGLLCAIIGIVGILNFFNAMMTAILARSREFAVLQSVGMTGRQLETMLLWEGLLYTLGSGLIAGLLSAAVNPLAGRLLESAYWFYSYHYTITPVLAMLPAFIVLGCAIPAVMYRQAVKQSIVERLRSLDT